MAITKLKKLLWIYSKIMSHDAISLKDLQELWFIEKVDDGKWLPTSSFRKYKNDIESLFDISIICKTKGNNYIYEIVKSDFDQDNPGKEWLAQLLNLELSWNHVSGIKNRIILDEAPIGGKYINQITEAISDSTSLEISYQSFFETYSQQEQIDPYWLKMHNQRWYLVAYSPQKKSIYPYALDRTLSISKLDKYFTYPKGLSADSYFKDSAGITVDMDYDIETISFKVYGTQQDYVKTLPLHHSQKIVEQNPELSIFEMVVRPSYELFEKLIAQQYHLEVLYPEWIREEITAIINDMGKRYR